MLALFFFLLHSTVYKYEWYIPGTLVRIVRIQIVRTTPVRKKPRHRDLVLLYFPESSPIVQNTQRVQQYYLAGCCTAVVQPINSTST